MHPRFHRVPVAMQNSFGTRLDKEPAFPTIWHYHPELELHYVIEGEGVRLIGDDIHNFSAGELILLGENLPHSWQCHEEYFRPNSGLQVEAIVMHFLPTCLGRDFLDLPETYLLNKLLEKAKKGMLIYGKTKDKIVKLLYSALKATNLERVIVFLSILKLLSETKEFKSIASAYAFTKFNESENLRFNNICTYTVSNYKKQVSLEEVAAVSNLSVTSFCRYFKMMAKKTYYEFLMEIRISHACRHLIEDKLTTSAICYSCGFNNISNFYRHFKKITGMTPFQYKRKYLSA